MIEAVIYLLFIILFYLTAYWISLYSLAVFVDPDEVESIYKHISDKQRIFVDRLADDARAFVQIAIVYKAFALIVSTVFTVLLAQLLSEQLGNFIWGAKIVALFFLWFSFIMIVEYLPRRSSRSAINEKMARRLWSIQLISFFVWPVVAFYRSALNKINPQAPVTEEEKEEIVERAIESLAEQAGIGESIVEEDEKEMIGQIFLLDKKIVREIMVPRIEIAGIEKSMSFVEIRDLVSKDGHSRFPVYEETIDVIIGLIYVKDLFNNMPQPGEVFDITRYLRKPYFVSEKKVIGDLLTEFKLGSHHIAIAMDQHGGVAGLVTLEDIIEEIVGDIQDEHVPQETEFASLADGRFLVNASMRVEKLQDYLHTDFEQDDYETVGGLIFHLVGSLPVPGEKIKWHDFEFEIEKVEGRRIKFVKVAAKGHAGV